jgi:hypothetical protein
MLANLPEELNSKHVRAALKINKNTVTAWTRSGKLKPIGGLQPARDRQTLLFRRDDILAMVADEDRAAVEALKSS